MLDIHFYQKVHELKKDLMVGAEVDAGYVFEAFNSMRSPNPVVYNIETTNNCNMKCGMCPRTTKMNIPIADLGMDVFKNVVDQISPWTKEEWILWENFVQENYLVDKNDVSENHFFLHIIPKVIQLHAYGAPLLDKQMPDRVQYLTDKGFSSYFSCNPANIGVFGKGDWEKGMKEVDIQTMRNGLSVIKYSFESIEDEVQAEVRGPKSIGGYEKVLRVLEEKEKFGLDTLVVITMLDLNRPNQQEDWEKLKEAFKDMDVYIYFKSEDQQWYRQKYHGTRSVHWTQFCHHPWASMTVKANGELSTCMEDYNNEIILGDASKESLYDVWNGSNYELFRRTHFYKTPGMKCIRECDMKLVGEMLLTGRIGSLEEERALIEFNPLIKNLPNKIPIED